MQTAWVTSLDYLNLLATVELLSDTQRELNLAVEDRPVAIRAWNPVIRHVELHPGDGPGIRDAYADRRYKIANFLKGKGVIRDFEVEEGSHRWENLILIDANRGAVNKALDLCIAEEHRRRLEAQPKPKTNESGQPTPDTIAPWTRGDKLSLAAVVIAALALIAAYLAVPGFQELVRGVWHAAVSR